MMAYSEELNMFTVHHYSPVPLFHVCTCMCRILTRHTDLYVYPTFKNRLLSSLFSVCRRGALTMHGKASQPIGRPGPR